MGKIVWGITANNHDAAISVFDEAAGKITFAAHAERYSRVKNDQHLNAELLAEAIVVGGVPTDVVWFENHWLKRSRQFFSGQYHEAFRAPRPKKYLNSIGWKQLWNVNWHAVSHHEAHALAGFYTSPFQKACVVVIDAIGEWDTVSIWKADGKQLDKLFSRYYPSSLGLFYSAMTQRLGLKPNEEEYIMMGMAAYGRPNYASMMKEDFFIGDDEKFFTPSLHRGCQFWRPELVSPQQKYNIAASAQAVLRDYVLGLMNHAKRLTGCDNLVFMGGVALNCVLNTDIANSKLFDDIWIMPNPGDAGSSLGAALALSREHVPFNPYLGTDVRSDHTTSEIVDKLLDGQPIGVAQGRAEFGPRALGHRSLLCDPRGVGVKDRVNEIKKREKFRPFAPMILAEHAATYFDMPLFRTPFMQFVAKCKQPTAFPAICHVDGTSRVQTVTKEEAPLPHAILTAWYERTGCPMLLNTSLNIKGKPLVNSRLDAAVFESLHGVKVF